MKTIKLTVAIFCAGIIMSCGSTGKKQETEGEAYVAIENMNIDNLLEVIKERESVLNQDSTAIDPYKAKELMDAYIVFADNFSQYKNADEYLFKAGEVAMGLNMTAESIKCFDRVYNEFPDYERKPYSLFLKAFVLENQAGNFEEATKAYNLFLENYPAHEMADDAEYSIKNMGKSPEELIREFEIQDSIKKAQQV
jgi:tetratricopeptide (TPR) repeat protein